VQSHFRGDDSSRLGPGEQRERDRYSTVAVVVVLVLAAVVGGATLLSGTVAAQSGSVTVQDPIFSDDTQFRVDVDSVSGVQSACLEVENTNTGEVYRETDVSGGESVAVAASDVGGLQDEDQIVARLYEFPFDCAGQVLATDSTIVQAPASFEVSITGVTDPVEAGEEIVLDYTITNTGDAGGTQDVVFLVGEFEEGRVSDLQLGPGEQFSGSFTYQTTGDDPPSVLAQVGTEDSFRERQVTVNEQPASFDVGIASTNSPIDEGEPLVMGVTVENAGGESDTQSVTLGIGGEIVDSASVALEPGQSTDIILEWQTNVSDSGDYDATVSSEDDTATTAVTINSQSEFGVSIDSTTSPVAATGTLEVSARIENTGEAAGSQEVSLAIDEETVDSTTVDLESGESRTVTLAWDTGPDDVGEHTATVASDDDAASTPVQVEEQGGFGVTVDSTNSPIVEGESLEVSATIENNGASEDSQEVALALDGSTVASTTVGLAAGESTTVSLSWDTTRGDAGEYTATVESEDSSDSAAVQVEEAALRVRIDSTTSPVTEGDRLAVSVTVENTGGDARGGEVTLAIDGETVDARGVELPGGGSTSLTLSWGTETGDAGEYTATVESEDDSDAAGVTVGAGDDETPDDGGEVTPVDGSAFGVEIESTNAPVDAGRTVEITARVTNTGSETATGRITLTGGGVERDSRELTIAGGESESVVLTWETGGDDPGEYTATVSAPEDQDVAAVSVLEPGDGDGSFAVTIDSVSAPENGSGNFQATATVENQGESSDTQQVTLSVDGVQRDSREVTLSEGESRSVTFSWEQEVGDEITIEVSSESDSDTTTAGVGSGGDGSILTSSWFLLLVLLLLVLAAYYYVRRRQLESETPVDEEGPGREESGSDGSGPEGTGPDGGGPDGSGPDRSGPDGSGPDRSGPGRGGPDRSGPDRSGPDRSGPDRSGPDGSGSDRSGPDRNGPDDRRRE